MRYAVVLVLVPLLGCASGCAQEGRESVKNSIGIELKLIPAGTFVMGSPKSQEDRFEDETPHEVTLSKPYYLGVT
ncbi:MAG: hypothetical protein ACKOCN_11805, partial [Planctomycetaceae bacterium]